MAHLGPEALIDLAEGTRAESSAGHLQECAECRRLLADLRATMHALGAEEVPEPSPLFWAHFSKRVRDGVAEEPAPQGTWWIGPWVRQHPAAACLVGAFAVVVAAAAVSMRLGLGMSPGGPPAPAPVSVASVEAPPDVEPAALADDAWLDLVADLAAQAGWDLEGEIGLETHEVTADTAVAQLTPAERTELQRLLNEELKRRGA